MNKKTKHMDSLSLWGVGPSVVPGAGRPAEQQWGTAAAVGSGAARASRTGPCAEGLGGGASTESPSKSNKLERKQNKRIPPKPRQDRAVMMQIKFVYQKPKMIRGSIHTS